MSAIIRNRLIRSSSKSRSINCIPYIFCRAKVLSVFIYRSHISSIINNDLRIFNNTTSSILKTRNCIGCSMRAIISSTVFNYNSTINIYLNNIPSRSIVNSHISWLAINSCKSSFFRNDINITDFTSCWMCFAISRIDNTSIN